MALWKRGESSRGNGMRQIHLLHIAHGTIAFSTP